MTDKKSTGRKSKQNKSPRSKEQQPDDSKTSDDNSIDNATNNVECPWGDGFVTDSQVSLRGHIMRVHQQGAKDSGGDGASRIQPDDEIGELVNEKKRLKLQAEIKTLERELDKVNGGSSEHHLERKVLDLERQLDRRNQEGLLKEFDSRFRVLEDEIRRTRSDGHQQRIPVQVGESRQIQDLTQQVYRLQRSLQDQQQNTLMGEINHLREQVQGSQNRAPQPYETQASIDKEFLNVSSVVGRDIIRELGGMRRDLKGTRDQLSKEVMPLVKVLGERMIGVKLREAAAEEPYQPEERELTPEQLEELDKRLEKKHGEDYREMPEDELEDEAERELELMRTEFLEETTEEEVEREIEDVESETETA